MKVHKLKTLGSMIQIGKPFQKEAFWRSHMTTTCLPYICRTMIQISIYNQSRRIYHQTLASSDIEINLQDKKIHPQLGQLQIKLIFMITYK